MLTTDDVESWSQQFIIAHDQTSGRAATAVTAGRALMCNEAFRNVQIARLEADWSRTATPLTFPEGRPNFAPLDSIRITDRIEIVRAGAGDSAEMVTRRWSWPGPTGKPVFNFRSDGRTIASGRCLIPVDGFFEFGPAPAAQPGLFDDAPAPKSGTKVKWRFTRPDADWFCIAGIWRTDPAVGEAFAMLTCEPGPDVAPYHARQVVVVARADHAAWLDGSAATGDICRPLPANSLIAMRAR